jgi:hypothetical protein
MLDPRFKHLKFLPENIRADALAHLTQLVGEDEEQPATTGKFTLMSKQFTMFKSLWLKM